MTDSRPPFYQPGHRQLQETFESQKLANRLEKIIIHSELSDEEKQFITSLDMFFISTVNDDGHPSVSYKGGAPGFIKVIDNNTLAFPGYDGNGMFLTAGNIISNAKVGLLFMSIESPHRLRVHGEASIDLADPLMNDYFEAQYIVRVSISDIFMNCSRYIHSYQKTESSQFVPKDGTCTPEPSWKSSPYINDALPPKK